jgi:hypothetical protein
MSGMGEGIFGDPPGSFDAMNIVDKMALEQYIRRPREEDEQVQKMAESVVSKTVEFEGEQNG